MYLGFWRIIALKPAPLLEVGRKCVSELSNSGVSVLADGPEVSYVFLILYANVWRGR